MASPSQLHKSSLYLFKIFGFEIRLDWSWFFLAILITWTLAAGYFPENFPGLSKKYYWIMGIVGAIGLFLSIIFHELAHSLVGRAYGIRMSGITLFIFGGVAEMRDAPENPKSEFLMSFAGPLFSIIFGFIFLFFFKFGTHHHWPIGINGVISYLATINFVVGIFNLLPGFPLDGGRIIRSLLWWWKKDLRWATLIACRSGAGLGFAMILLGIILMIEGGIIAGLWMFLLGFFLQHISSLSYQDMLISEFFRGETIKKYVKINPISVQEDMSIQDLVEHYFYKYYHKLYPVTKNNLLIGCISFNEIKQIPKEKWRKLTVKEVMQPCSKENVIDAETEVTQVLRLMQSERISRLIVTENQQLYGTITLKDLMDIISMKLNLENKDED